MKLGTASLVEFSRLYRRSIDVVADGSSPLQIEFWRVPAKRLRVLQRVTVEDETNAYTQVRLGIHALGKDYYLDELKNPAAGELAVEKSEILLGDSDVFFVEMTGVTSGDKIRVTAIGWELDL